MRSYEVTLTDCGHRNAVVQSVSFRRHRWRAEERRDPRYPPALSTQPAPLQETYESCATILGQMGLQISDAVGRASTPEWVHRSGYTGVGDCKLGE